MEDDDLAAKRQVLANMGHNLLRLDGFQQVAARQVIELLGDLVAQLAQRHGAWVGLGHDGGDALPGFARSLVPRFALRLEPLQRLVDARPDGRFDQDEAAIVIRLDVQHATSHGAALLQPAIELALHQTTVDLGIWLGQLAISHPVAEVLHEELVVIAALAVVPELVELVAAALVVIEQVAIRPIDGLLIGERGSRQKQSARSLLTLAGCYILLDGGHLGIDLAEKRLNLGLSTALGMPVALIVGIALRLGQVFQLGETSIQVGMQHPCAGIDTIRVQCQRLEGIERQRCLAAGIHGQLVRLIGNNQIPLSVR